MIPSHAAAAALERLGGHLPRSSDVQCLRAFLAESQAQIYALEAEQAHLRCDRDRWSARASGLERELTAARERERRNAAERVALAAAAEALCAALDGSTAAAAGRIGTALAGPRIQAIVLELHESTSTACLYAVLRRMFRKLGTPQTVARTAERWVVDQLRRRTPTFAERVDRRCGRDAHP